jgi:hypothetical protein
MARSSEPTSSSYSLNSASTDTTQTSTVSSSMRSTSLFEESMIRTKGASLFLFLLFLDRLSWSEALLIVLWL